MIICAEDEAQRQASDIVAHYQEENPDAERFVSESQRIVHPSSSVLTALAASLK